MRKVQTKELRRAILQHHLSDKEKNDIYNDAKSQPGDTRKIMRQKIWEAGSKRKYLYKQGKKIFKQTPKNRKDIIRVY